MKLRVAIQLIVCLVITSAALGVARPAVASNHERPPLGVVIIDPLLGDWHAYQRPLFRASDFDFAKVHLPPGFNTTPSHIVDLIEDGASRIVLKTEDCETDPRETYRHLTARGFLDLIDAYPHVTFVVQVGNEPERCPLSMDAYVQGLIDTAAMLRPVVERPNLEWMAGLPMDPGTARSVIEEDNLLRYYDAVGTNMLGHLSLIEERHAWHDIVDYVLDETDAELWLTEIGINHPPMDKAEKAARVLAYIDTLPTDRVGGVAIFALAMGSEWPQYEYVESMVPVINDRGDCHYFVAVDRWLCDNFKRYWDEYGGLGLFGYPITDVYRDANGRRVQYLERARFELHPGAWPEQHDVLLGHLGREAIDRLDNDAMLQADEPDASCRYFPQTGQNLCGEFLQYWNAFGGLPIFGFPISQRVTRDGVPMQYFERARFERHPGAWPERFDVLQGLLGVELLDRRE